MRHFKLINQINGRRCVQNIEKATLSGLVKNRLRRRSAIEFLGLWGRLNNPGFKPLEFDGFNNDAGEL